jgi:hypothetical protein
MGVRKGKWVYIPGQDGGGFQGKAVGDHLLGGAAALLLTGQINSDVVDGRIRSDAPSAQLYELDKDPFQTTNVYSQFPEVVERLEAIRQDYERQIEYEHTLGWIFLDQQR